MYKSLHTNPQVYEIQIDAYTSWHANQDQYRDVKCAHSYKHIKVGKLNTCEAIHTTSPLRHTLSALAQTLKIETSKLIFSNLEPWWSYTTFSHACAVFHDILVNLTRKCDWEDGWSDKQMKSLCKWYGWWWITCSRKGTSYNTRNKVMKRESEWRRNLEIALISTHAKP